MRSLLLSFHGREQSPHLHLPQTLTNYDYCIQGVQIVVKKIALVTGANKGIGFEVSKQLAELGYRVVLGCRNRQLGEEATERLRTSGLTDPDFSLIDVTDFGTITSTRGFIESRFGVLDVLVNNAGILGTVPQPALSYPVEEVRRIFDTNFFGAIQVAQEFIPLLQRSEAGRIANVTSGLGSLTLHSDPTWKYYAVKSAGYAVSKTALNGFTVMLAYALKETKIRVNAIDPEHTSTDFNRHRGTRTPEHSAQVIVKYATMGDDCPTGKYINEDGELPW